jgi:hypothetical protein
VSYPRKCAYCPQIVHSGAELRTHREYRDLHGDCAFNLITESEVDRRYRLTQEALGREGFDRERMTERAKSLSPPLHLMWQPFRSLHRAG